jgi:hypothetical protein
MINLTVKVDWLYSKPTPDTEQQKNHKAHAPGHRRFFSEGFMRFFS